LGPNFEKNKDNIKGYDENNAQDKEKRKSNEFFHLNSSHRNLLTIFLKIIHAFTPKLFLV
jgi:hypothetical protein